MKLNIMVITRPVTRGGSRRGEVPPGKMFWTKFKSIGHSVKNLSPSHKTLRHPWRPKLVTGLVITKHYVCCITV